MDVGASVNVGVSVGAGVGVSMGMYGCLYSGREHFFSGG